MAEDAITVLVVDDHPVFRDGLGGFIGSEPGLDLVASCPDGEEAILLAEEHQPDVVLMDLHLPGLSGTDHELRAALAEWGGEAYVQDDEWGSDSRDPWSQDAGSGSTRRRDPWAHTSGGTGGAAQNA